MAVEGQGEELIQIVTLLGAGVVAVPVFRRLGLGSVLGYFTAGLLIGPFGLRLFTDPEAILHVAEFGVIMLLFVIGLEMQPSRLWKLKAEIFGLGATQVALCAALLTAVGVYIFRLPPAAAFIAGSGFVLSSTAVVVQMLNERGETATPEGQKAVSILLLEDLMIVPLLAIVALLTPGGTQPDMTARAQEIALAALVITGFIAAGRFLLNPLFRILAAANAREVMTAAALLVVLGAALLMEVGGLSMAMGAFLAGVLLSESTFRHQLEADIEPFRGLLLGLFFLAVGMSLDLAVIAREWRLIMAATIAFTAVKGLGIYIVARIFRSSNRDALTRVSLFAQGGEFAFVLYAAALGEQILNSELAAVFTAVVIISMAITPLTALLVRTLMGTPEPSLDGVERAEDLRGNALVIGFGRFGQVASQSLLARGFNVSIIEKDVEMIRAAPDFGFLVHYGDGTRLDILHASGAGRADAVLICVDKKEAAERIVELMQSEFPMVKLFVRAWDRGHAIDLIHKNVEFQIRETFESALLLGEAALRGLGVPEDEAAEITIDLRSRDQERLDLQLAGGISAGRDLMIGNAPRPGPLTTPRKPGRVVGETPDPA